VISDSTLRLGIRGEKEVVDDLDNGVKNADELNGRAVA